MGVIVLREMIGTGRTGMAKLDLDGRVPNIELLAESRLQLPHYMLGVSQRLVLDDNVSAEGEVL